MKKLIALMLCLTMALSLAACTNDKPVETKPNETKPVEVVPEEESAEGKTGGKEEVVK